MTRGRAQFRHRQHGALQGAQARVLRRRLPADRLQEGAEVQLRDWPRSSWPRGREGVRKRAVTQHRFDDYHDDAQNKTSASGTAADNAAASNTAADGSAGDPNLPAEADPDEPKFGDEATGAFQGNVRGRQRVCTLPAALPARSVRAILHTAGPHCPHAPRGPSQMRTMRLLRSSVRV